MQSTSVSGWQTTRLLLILAAITPSMHRNAANRSRRARTPDPRPHLEAALRAQLALPEVMIGQLDRLAGVVGFPMSSSASSQGQHHAERPRLRLR